MQSEDTTGMSRKQPLPQLVSASFALRCRVETATLPARPILGGENSTHPSNRDAPSDDVIVCELLSRAVPFTVQASAVSVYRTNTVTEYPNGCPGGAR
jgi:hypothetical protein